MIHLAKSLNPTQFIGLTAYLFAATSCTVAWAASRNAPRPSRLAAVFAVLEAALVLDMAFNIRWRLHDALQAEAVRADLYTHRAAPQLAALGLLGVAAVTGMGLAFQYLRGRTGATLATCGVILSLSCWGAEVVSFHAIDAVFYHTVHKVKMVSLCWVAFSMMTGLGILWEARAARSIAKQGAKSAAKPPSSLTSS